MKLVELLARELDVWPDHGCVQITQDGDRNVFYWRRDGAVFDGEEWEHPSGGLCDTLWWLDDLPAVLAEDYKTAIITRADWQAERERIAGGWIAWGGGECPVDRAEFVEVKYRDGTMPRYDESYCWTWAHDGNDDDIIAYRLHKPEQASAEAIESGIAAADAGKVKPIEEVKAMHEYNPIHTRNRILEIDRTTEALEGERGQLVQRLADEGFVLARVDGRVAPAEDMSDWRNWKAGDSVEVISDDDDESGHKKGAILKINEVEKQNYSGNLPVECSPEGPCGDWPDIANIRWHSRPTA